MACRCLHHRMPRYRQSAAWCSTRLGRGGPVRPGGGGEAGGPAKVRLSFLCPTPTNTKNDKSWGPNSCLPQPEVFFRPRGVQTHPPGAPRLGGQFWVQKLNFFSALRTEYRKTEETPASGRIPT